MQLAISGLACRKAEAWDTGSDQLIWPAARFVSAIVASPDKG